MTVNAAAAATKRAAPDYPIHELITQRWSPYVYAPRAVSAEDLRGVFEAARWAPSAYNEQPWRFIVARRGEEGFERLLSCLVEPNQAWAKEAGALALGVISETYAMNGEPNGTAEHDLGLAVASLTFEATARGLSVHQMGGILPERARELYGIPAGFRALTGIAIGYAGDPSQAGEGLASRDGAPRSRRPQAEFVFGAGWGQAATLG